MPPMQIDTKSGLQTSLDVAGQGTSVLRNWRTDASGTNIPRSPLKAYTLSGINADTTIIGAYVFKGDLILVGSDRYVYRVPSIAPGTALALSTSTLTTQLEGTERPVFAEDPSDLFIAGGGAIQKWTPGDFTTARLGDGQLTSTTHITALGSRLIANDRATDSEINQFFWSDLGDGADATWNALSFATAEARPDKVVAIYENTSELFVFGESTIEVYAVGPDPNNPFQRINTVNVGLLAPYSPIRYEGLWYFIDESGRIVASDGRSDQIRHISAPILTDLRDMSKVSDAFGWREREGRYDMLVWHFPDAQRTFEYDVQTEQWHERAYYSPTGKTQADYPVGAYAHWPKLKKHMIGRNDTNGVSEIDGSVGQELGGVLLCERRTGVHSFDTPKRKRSRGVYARMRRGTVATGTTPAPLEIRVRDDGGSWSPWEPLSVGNEGDGNLTERIYPGGVFRDRLYDIRYAGSDATSLVAIYDDVEELDS